MNDTYKIQKSNKNSKILIKELPPLSYSALGLNDLLHYMSFCEESYYDYIKQEER